MADIAIHPDVSHDGIKITSYWKKAHLKFFLYRVLTDFEIPDRPHFDDEGTRTFDRLLPQSHLYMEYGSGGSTVLAATLGKKFISVESDIRLSKRLSKRIKPDPTSGTILGINIGGTGAWGAPLFTRPTTERAELWKNYITAPWSKLDAGELPDLILIDGRFRVACALYSLIKLHEKPAATILFDDYADRPHYHVAEKYGRLERLAGRMAVFHPDPSIPVEEISRALDHYAIDWQ